MTDETEVEAMCDRLSVLANYQPHPQDVIDGLAEAIIFIRKQAARIKEWEAAVDCAHANGQDWLQQIYDLKAQIAELQKLLRDNTDRLERVCPDADGKIDPADAKRIKRARAAITGQESVNEQPS